MRTIESFGKIYKVHIESSLPFCTPFNNISQRENMIDTSPYSPETAACYSRSLSSTASNRRLMMTFAKILLGVDNSVMPRQLLHSERAPFFGILMMIPSFQSSGILLLSHMVMKGGCKMFAVITGSALNSSALRRSLGALCYYYY